MAKIEHPLLQCWCVALHLIFFYNARLKSQNANAKNNAMVFSCFSRINAKIIAPFFTLKMGFSKIFVWNIILSVGYLTFQHSEKTKKILKFVYFCIGATYIATNYRNSTHFLPTGVQRTCESNVHKQKVYRFFCFYQNLISMLIWVCKWPYFALFFWKFRNIMRIITHNA